jgi:ankyrin repeat protein
MGERLKQSVDPVSIRSILLDEENLLDPWLEFLEANYAIENYRFFLDVLRFRKMVKDLANTIFDKYVAKSATEEVNLMWSTREGIEATIREPNVNMWNTAQDEVLIAFESDLLPKFLISKQYLAWKGKREIHVYMRRGRRRRRRKRREYLPLSSSLKLPNNNNKQKTTTETRDAEAKLSGGRKKRMELVEAVRQGASIEVIQNLLQTCSILDADVERQTALHVAASRHDSFELAVFLIGRNADLHAFDVNCWTPLHVAANAGNLLVSLFLFFFGFLLLLFWFWFSLFMLTHTHTFLLFALQTCQFLLSKGANSKAETNEGNYPLHYLVKNTYKAEEAHVLLSVMENMLADHGLELDHQTKKGETVLHYACLSQQPDLVMPTLLRFGANPNIINKRGNTPLHMAVLKKQTSTIQLLLQHGANPTIPGCKQGGTVLELAKTLKCNSITDLLEGSNKTKSTKQQNINTSHLALHLTHYVL